MGRFLLKSLRRVCSPALVLSITLPQGSIARYNPAHSFRTSSSYNGSLLEQSGHLWNTHMPFSCSAAGSYSHGPPGILIRLHRSHSLMSIGSRCMCLSFLVHGQLRLIFCCLVFCWQGTFFFHSLFLTFTLCLSSFFLP